MKLIKAAIVYKAELPTDLDALNEHLEERRFAPPLSLELRSAGFVAVTDEHSRLAASFPGGIAFRVRIDEKVLPGAVIKAEVAKTIATIQQEQGRKPGRKERAEIKEGVMVDLAQRALVRTAASLTCFYHSASGYLIVPTTSKKIADTCVTLLVAAVGSVKTETINVSEVKHGLTTRLKKWLGGDLDAFGAFSPCDQAALADGGKRKLTVKMGELQTAREGLTAAIERAFGVTSLGFEHKGIEFRMTDEFRLKGLRRLEEEVATDDEDPWATDAMADVEATVGILDELTQMLAYKDETAEAA